MRNAKKISVLALFIVLVAPLAAPLILQLKILFIEIKAKERLERTQLITIHVSRENFTWAKPGEEIILGGKLFDVKQILQKEKDFVVTGLFDEQETNLGKKLDKLWQEHRSRQGLLLFKYLKQLGKSCIRQSPPAAALLTSECNIYSIEKQPSEKDVFIKIPSPPPQSWRVLPFI